MAIEGQHTFNVDIAFVTPQIAIGSPKYVSVNIQDNNCELVTKVFVSMRYS